MRTHPVEMHNLLSYYVRRISELEAKIRARVQP